MTQLDGSYGVKINSWCNSVLGNLLSSGAGESEEQLSPPLEWGLVGRGPHGSPSTALSPTSIPVPRHRSVEFCAHVSESGQEWTVHRR